MGRQKREKRTKSEQPFLPPSHLDAKAGEGDIFKVKTDKKWKSQNGKLYRKKEYDKKSAK